MQIAARQSRNAARPETQTLEEYSIRREHKHLIGMRLLRIDIREEEARFPAASALMIIDV